MMAGAASALSDAAAAVADCQRSMADLTQDMADLRTDVQRDTGALAMLDKDAAELRSELRREATRFRNSIAELRVEFVADTRSSDVLPGQQELDLTLLGTP